MKTNKLLLATIIQSVLVSPIVYAGDVEVQLPTEVDAFTVDQPVGTELMRVNGNGNVGIGTVTPQYSLQIGGGQGRALQFESETDEFLSYGLRSSLTDFKTVVESKGGVIISLDNDMNATDDNGQDFAVVSDADLTNVLMVLKGESGRVGIGTSNPPEKLSLDGVLNFHIGGDNALLSYIQYDSASASNYKKTNDNRGTALNFDGDAGNILFRRETGETPALAGEDTNPIENILFLGGETGWVGVQTSNPRVHLDVAGSVKIADSGVICDGVSEGQIRYDATTKTHQGCDGTSWNDLY